MRLPRRANVPLSCFAVVFFLQSCATSSRGGPTFRQPSPEEIAATCLKSRGCPPPKPFPRCSDEMISLAREYDEVLSGEPDEQPLGTQVRLRGPMVRGLGSCTLAGCNFGCCNECGHGRALGVRTSRAKEISMILVNGDDLVCAGDESLVCCPFEFDDKQPQEVIVQGRLDRLGQYYIVEHSSVCALPRPKP